jgi:SAM-dependent methyltransferase|nr:MAG TPA: hemK protein [Caudoviricetes sp.]
MIDIDYSSLRPVLDVCCGGRLFYYERNTPVVTFQDIRRGTFEAGEGRTITVDPDVAGDFTNLSYEDGGEHKGFALVVFDPPHLKRAGPHSFMRAKYGVLDKDWKKELGQGFRECFRVLRNDGVLVFKWSTSDIPMEEVLKLSPYRPLLGDQRGHTRWAIFIKHGGMRRKE